jgi:hypothetical protein
MDSQQRNVPLYGSVSAEARDTDRHARDGEGSKADIAEFQKESNAGRDSDVKSSTLPTLQDYLSHAEQVESKVNSSAQAQ